MTDATCTDNVTETRARCFDARLRSKNTQNAPFVHTVAAATHGPDTPRPQAQGRLD